MRKGIMPPHRVYECIKCGWIHPTEIKEEFCPMCGTMIMTHTKCGNKVYSKRFGEMTKVY